MEIASHQEYYRRGLDALRRGSPEEALTLLERAAADAPTSRILSALGTARWRLGRRSEGIEALRRAVEMNPGDPTAVYNLSVALVETGEVGEARGRLEKIARLHPDHANARRLLERIAPGSVPPPSPDGLDRSTHSAFDRASVGAASPARIGASLPSRLVLDDSIRGGDAPAGGSDSRPTAVEIPEATFASVPWVSILFIAVNCAIYFLMERAGGSTNREVMISYGSQFRPLVLEGEAWRLVTAMFIHAGGAHIFWNMAFFAISAYWVESFHGPARFSLLVLGGGIAGNLMTLLLTTAPTAGASGAVLGVLGALIVIGFRHGSSLPGSLRWKFRWIPLLSCAWVFLSGLHNPQTNNIAHVAGFVTGIVLALLQAPRHVAEVRRAPGLLRPAAWGMAAICLYACMGMAWSVRTGVDESEEILLAKRKLAQGRIAVRLTHFRDPARRCTMKVPEGWERRDQLSGADRMYRWTSPMLDASLLFLTFPVPSGQGGLQAMAIERMLSREEGGGSLRVLSREKRTLSGRVGGRIACEGLDDSGSARQVIYYFVPIDDVLYILVSTVRKSHSSKYTPVFDTVAASFRAGL